MSFGRYSSFPFRFGRSTGRTPELLDQTYRAAHGSAFDVDSLDGYLACESLAVARVLSAGQDLSQCASNQNNPAKATVHLDRWEAMLQVIPGLESTPNERRAELVRRLRYLSLPASRVNLEAFLTESLGACFLRLDLSTYADSGTVQSTPEGLDLTGIDGPLFADWDVYSSSLAVLRIIVDPDQVESRNFQALLSRLYLLDDWIPAWVAWEWTYDDFLRCDLLPGLDGGKLS